MPKQASATKKAAPKKVAKKVAPKKAAAKKPSAKKTLVYADNTHSFWVTDGQILNSLVALHDALKAMDKAVYAHHVSKDKHDFADWVDAVLCDGECAEALRKAKTPTTARAVVTKYLKVYNA